MRCASCGFDNPQEFRFCGKCGESLGGETPPAERDTAERRHLVVMFCDLADSSSLAERLDPEELREVVRDYQTECGEAISRFGGHIAQYLGDGLLVYFGYPRAHEDDSARAVHAALTILEHLEHLNTRLERDRDLKLAIRIGIDRGLVVAGAMGSGQKTEQLALGQTPNIAARLQGLAKPNTIVVSDAVHRLTQHAFHFDPLGARELKGVSEPMHVFGVRGAIEAGEEIGTAIAEQRPLAGRDHELGIIDHCLRQARAGHGQSVFVAGQPGIGKSRLILASLERARAQGHMSWSCRCSALHLNSPLFSIVQLFEQLMRLVDAGSTRERLAQLERAVTDAGLSVADAVPILASLFMVPLGEGYTPSELAGEQRKKATFELLATILVNVAVDHPMVVVVEDLHWADPSTLEFLDGLQERLSTTRIALLVTSRTPPASAWAAHPAATTIDLAPLEEAHVEAIVQAVTGGKTLPAEVVRQIVNGTDGVPLFVEEMVKVILESGSLRETREAYELVAPMEAITVPATLQDALMARLDHLTTAKEIAQLGAIIGREFPTNLLLAIAPMAPAAVSGELARLVDADLLRTDDLSQEPGYRFTHALIQETAYNSILHSRRRQTHRQVAQALAAEFSDVAERLPEVVGHHWSTALAHDQAAPCWRRAAERAKAVYGNEEAIAYYRSALDEVGTILDRDDPPAREWLDSSAHLREGLADVMALVAQREDARTALHEALTHVSSDDRVWRARVHRKIGTIWVNEHDHVHAERAFDEAMASLGPDADSDPAWWQEWLQIRLEMIGMHYWKAQVAEMMALQSEIEPVIRKHGSPPQRAAFFGALAHMNFRRHRYVVPDEVVGYAQSFVTATQELDSKTALCEAKFTLGLAQLFCNHPNESAAALHEALELAEKTGDSVMQARCVTYLALVARRQRTRDDVDRLSADALARATSAEMPDYQGVARANQAWLAWGNRNLDAVEAASREALDLWDKAPAEYPFKWTALLPLLSVQLERQDVEHAVSNAQPMLEPAQQALPEPITTSLNAAVAAWHQGDADATRARLEHVIQTARETGFL